ncbi:DUF4142 domain-containing protein [Acidovorax sp. SRB_24]|uniref:DUF4142 domain-containing protein n=1 Tax=Acidovorax sp. SRB_24 TaxID=1962700 RepID=UPI00145CAB0E|nr:DUF4142 domain-containing protein [Acidovorax sp. SRB_24]NMM77742.1 hypothetical protein [Acidovorax sp. SRB_24]
MKSFSLTPVALAVAMALALPAAAQMGGSAGGTGGTGSTGTSSSGGPGGGTGPSGSSSPMGSGPAASTPRSTAAPAAAGASTPSSASGQATAGAMAAVDRTFMTKAAGSGLYEVEASRLAAQRASSGEVRDFAQMMVSDHEKANQELMALASARGVTLPQDMPADKRKELDRLSKAKDFDAEYMRNTGVKEHKAAVALFEKASTSAKDADLKAWVAQKLPTLREHLEHAQNIKPGKARSATGA